MLPHLNTLQHACEFCGHLFTPKKNTFGRYCSRTCSNRANAIPLGERFWPKVVKSEGCWEWQGNRRRRGYGRLMVGKKREVPASRVAWELTYGPIPDGLIVCHSCDNPPCCRPDHLFLGTYADNLADMKAKDRHARGERHGQAKLSDADAIEIRRRYAAGGVLYKELARDFGVSIYTISLIVIGKTWRHLIPG